MKKITTEEFINRAKQVHGDRYDYSLVEYTGVRYKIKIICSVHGVFEQIPSSHLKGSGCIDCSNINQSKTTEEFINRAKEIHGDRYDYSLVEYTNNRNKVVIICPEHGKFQQRPKNHLYGSGCLLCGGTEKLSLKQFIDRAKQVHGDKYDYSLVEYTNGFTKIKIICSKHGVFEQIPRYHLQGNGCIKCSKTIGIDQFISKASNIHNNKYDYSLVRYDKSSDIITIICPEHGEFKQRANNHINIPNGCPTCGKIVSYKELELQEWLSQYTNIITNDRKLISPLELDIIIPSHKIAIEYNGLYWHSERQGKDKKYHLNKYNLCKDKSYRLIQIWENEWIYKQDIVKSIILSALNIYERKIHGRKCDIRSVDIPTSRYFYDNNHIQGFKGGEHHGLYYNNDLVSLMTISKHNELERFVNKQNTLVYGAFTKLLKSFNNIDNLVTFADIRYFTGNVYESNGFEYQYHVEPRYWYIKGSNVYHRRMFQKKMIKRKYDQSQLSEYNDNLNEYQNMLNNGYDRIWDCGNIKYILKF